MVKAQRGRHWEGWAQLDGLLSGSLPEPGAASALRASLAAQAGSWPPAQLDVDGGRFHLLMGDAPFEVPPGGEAALASSFTEQLEHWLGAGGIEVSTCESTVRLRRWSAGTEEQTLIVPAPNGLQAMSRQVEVATLTPPALARWSRRRRWIEAALFLAAGLLAWFLLKTMAPAPAAAPATWSEVELELGPWEGLLTLEEQGGQFTLHRALARDELRSALTAAEPGSPRALALEDLARGRVRLRCFDATGQALGPAWIGLALEANATPLRVPLPPGCERVRLVL